VIGRLKYKLKTIEKQKGKESFSRKNRRELIKRKKVGKNDF